MDQQALPSPPQWRKYVTALIAAEISAITRYSSSLFQFKARSSDSGLLLEAIDCPHKVAVNSIEDLLNEGKGVPEHAVILLNDNFNHEDDIEALLRSLNTVLPRSGRILAVSYNPYLRWLYSFASAVGVREGEQPTTFITNTDLNNIARLAGYEVVRVRSVGFCPWRLWGFGALINSVFAALPLLRWLSLAVVIILRPIKVLGHKPSLSVIIPARNECGNIEGALERMPDFGAPLEIIFIEGHSSDGTWEEIQRISEKYANQYTIRSYKQSGKGKADAVRLGFSRATGELLTILDADLTMPPELLLRFYDAWNRGLGDFINGNRLVYAQEGQAMKFLNRLGNVFFAKALSSVLDTHLGDSLCGTKLLSKADYLRFCAWRTDFGEFDPFGDFELIFPAAVLGLGIIDIPLRYRDRVYGSTSIRRFYHGWMLLKMTGIGLIRLKLGRCPTL